MRMLKQEHLTIITVIIFILPVAIFIPAFVGATQADTQTDSLIIETDEPKELGENIEIRVESISSNDSEIGVYDMDAGDFESETIDEGDSFIYVFENGDIKITLDDIQTSERIGVTVEYPTDFGWDSEENRVNEAMPPMVILPIIIIILAVLFAVIKTGSDS